MNKSFVLILWLTILLGSCKNTQSNQNEQINSQEKTGSNLVYESEKHFVNVKQLTFGGNNAEAYWSFDGQALCFQSDYKEWGAECDQIYHFRPFEDDLKQANPKHISIKKGRTTCSYFLPGDSLILFASTQGAGEMCPHVAPRKPGGKYTWPLFPDYEIYISNLQGTIKKQLTQNQSYDAEATVSPRGDKIVFTSDRSGDLELYTMDINGNNVKQITNEIGYDGGAFFSPDGSKIIFRASRPKTDSDKLEYKELLSQGLVQPTNMELFVCNADGSELKQLTSLGKANWAPFFHPSGQKVIFASNHAGSKGFQFNLYMINLDGSGLEKITADSTFDAFPVFSPNGKHLVFSSNRNNGGTHDTNLFLAEWKD